MDGRSVFFEEWLNSLREQYKHVVRNDDRVTLPTLSEVLQNVGFTEDELRQLRLEATMHIDDVSDDFVADLDILPAATAAPPHPNECHCPECAPIDESAFDADGQPLTPDPDEAAYESGHVFPVADIEALGKPDESDPITFEDSLATDHALDTPDLDAEADASEDDESDNPDTRQQMSLF